MDRCKCLSFRKMLLGGGVRATLPAVALAACMAGTALAQQRTAKNTLDQPVGSFQEYRLDSGPRANLGNVENVVFDQEIQVAGSNWLRLYFGEVQLDEGSYLRITAPLDGEVQILDELTVRMWNHSTAYFNGDTVILEMVAGPNTELNLVTVEEVAVEFHEHLELGGPGVCGICGSDNRVASDEDWSARLFPAGCTASVINEDSCMISAGHCLDTGGGDVVQFNVPNSNSNCSTNNPPVADQFPVVFKQFVNGGVGNDWGVMLIGTNNQGQQPFDRYGEFRPVATGTPGTGQNVEIYGYGVDQTCVVSQTQRFSQGPIASVFTNFVEITVDLTGGNSGSGVLRTTQQDIIAVVTHCPCPNAATRVTQPAFANAIISVCAGDPPDSDCCIANGTPGCDDQACEDLICAQDPFCCNTSWDGICAAAALEQCAVCQPGKGEDCCDGSEVPEGEACGADTNGGCNSTPPAFTTATCGTTYCGTAWAEGTRDTDWYLVNVAAGSTITGTLESVFQSVCFIVDGIGACAPVVIGDIGCGVNCTNTAVASATVGAAGGYVVFVATGNCDGSGIFDGAPCSVNPEYRLTIECVPDGGGDDCPGSGDCCEPNGTPGCDNTDCCETVCAADPFCCDNMWDQLCADQAADLCAPLCDDPPDNNDDCEDAFEIFDGNTAYSNIGATNDGPPLPASCDEGFGTDMGSDIWYTYIPTCTGTLTVSTCDQADYDTRLAAYLGDCGAFLACNDDGPNCGGFTSIMEVPVVCGEKITLRVGGFGDPGAQGSGTLTLTCAGTPCGVPCPTDLDGDGNTGVTDLVILIGAWGPNPGHPADFDSNGDVGVTDLVILIGAWGPCP